MSESEATDSHIIKVDIEETKKNLILGNSILKQHIPYMYDPLYNIKFNSKGYCNDDNKNNVLEKCGFTICDGNGCTRICTGSSKDAHGKVFETNINQCISAILNSENENDIKLSPTHTIFIQNMKKKNMNQSFELPIFEYDFIPLFEHRNDVLDLTVKHLGNINTPIKRVDTDTGEIDPHIANKHHLHPLLKWEYQDKDITETVRDKQKKLNRFLGNGINVKYCQSMPSG